MSARMSLVQRAQVIAAYERSREGGNPIAAEVIEELLVALTEIESKPYRAEEVLARITGERQET